MNFGVCYMNVLDSLESCKKLASGDTWKNMNAKMGNGKQKCGG